jgi:hypothetical protein
MTATICVLFVLAAGAADRNAPDEGPQAPVSFHKQIWPILQRRCQGCHQPAKNGGELLLTSFADLAKGGGSGPVVVPRMPDDSLLFNSLVGRDAEIMPKDADPLPPDQIDLVRRWIAEGALDDTPPEARDDISPENPPVYEGMPLVAALAFSNDGETLAVGGYREILLHAADGSQLKSRLVGMSQRIESLAYSPDGELLAACGGSPGRFGEIQIWDVRDNQLKMAAQFATDTLFGVHWSSDGGRLAFGGPDNTGRVVLAADGKQILQFDHHTDWVLGVVFSLDDKHLVSVSRDRAVKLTQTDSGAFIDNVTSITPGALTGGLEALDRHPTRNEVAVGGVDGVPKLYRIFRQQARQIGDDFNLIRTFAPLAGPVREVQFSRDGARLAVAGAKEARVYETDSGKQLCSLPFDNGVYSVAVHPTNGTFAAAGYDGVVKIAKLDDGTLLKEFVPVPLAPGVARH